MMTGRYFRLAAVISLGVFVSIRSAMLAQPPSNFQAIDLAGDPMLDQQGSNQTEAAGSAIPEEAFVTPPSTEASLLSLPSEIRQERPGFISTEFSKRATKKSEAKVLDVGEHNPPVMEKYDRAGISGPIVGGVSGEPDPTAGSFLLADFLEFISPTDPASRDNFQFNFGTSVGYDNNVLYSPTDPIASGTASVFTNIVYSFGVPRFALDTRITLQSTSYEQRPGGERDDAYGIQLAASYQVRPRLRMSLSTRTAYQSQPNSTQIGGIFFFTGPYSSTDTEFTLVYEVRPRFSLDFGYVANTVQYEDEIVNQQSGFFSQTYSLTLNYLITPRTTVLVEYRFNPLTFPDADLGSTGQILTFGVSRRVSPRFNWTLQLGGEFRSIKNPPQNTEAPTEYAGPFAVGELRYNSGPATEIVGTLRFGTEPSGVAGITIRRTFRMGLSVDHAFGQRFSAELGLNFQNDFYDLPGSVSDYSQDVTTGVLTLNYQYNPSLGAFARFEYLQVASEIPDSDLSRSVISTGLDITF